MIGKPATASRANSYKHTETALDFYVRYMLDVEIAGQYHGILNHFLSIEHQLKNDLNGLKGGATHGK